MAYTPPKSGAAHQFETGDNPTAGPSFAQPAFSDLSGTASNSQLAGPLVSSLAMPAELSVSNPGGVGAATISKANENANTVWAGPTSGLAAAPAFRGLVLADLPTSIPNSDLAGPLVSGVTIGAGGDFALSKTDPTGVGAETLTPGNVTATHLSSPLPVAQGGTGDSTLTAHGVLLGEGTSAVAVTTTQTAGQLLVGQSATTDPLWKSVSGDATMAASGAVSVVKVNGNTPGVSAVAHEFVSSIDSSARGTLTQPSTADLSDIATGTWTPTIRGDGTAGAVTYVRQSGYYFKIGALVYVSAWVQWSAFAGATGNFEIAGLPFTVANLTNYEPQGPASNITGLTFTANYTYAGMQGTPNTTTALVVQNGSGQGAATIPVGSVAASGQVIFTLIYRNA